MKIIFTNKAFTLIELIVALSLLSVIFLGILSINIVLNNNNQDYGQKYIVKSQTQATLNHILNNASLAVGSNTQIVPPFKDTGILIGGTCTGTSCGDLDLTDVVNNPNTFCIHQPVDNSPGDNSNIINSTTTDIWLCYTYYGPATASSATAGPDQIWYCTMPFTYNGTSQRGAGSCNPTLYPAINSGPTFLGTAFSISTVPVGSTFPQSPYLSATNGQLLFSITIQNCLNDLTPPGTCTGSGTTDSANNPQIQLTGSVIPQQESI